MEELLHTNDFWKTTDLVQCCCLIYFNHTLEAIDKSDPNRCVFYVRRHEQTDEIIENFHKGLVLVEPKGFCAIQKEIKGRIYNN